MSYARLGEATFAKAEKANGELLALMYGSLVTQLIKDLDDIDSVNAELSSLGETVGLRLVEEFLSETDIGACSNFRETCEVLAKTGLKMFLGITADVTSVSKDGKCCTIQIPYNPMIEFVELPPNLDDLQYCNFLCGCIKGALEQLHIKVTCDITKDVLVGDDVTELTVQLVQILKDEFVDLEDN